MMWYQSALINLSSSVLKRLRFFAEQLPYCVFQQLSLNVEDLASFFSSLKKRALKSTDAVDHKVIQQLAFKNLSVMRPVLFESFCDMLHHLCLK